MSTIAIAQNFTVKVSDTLCVTAQPERVKAVIENYSAYAGSPGSTYTILGNLTALDMVTSTSSPSLSGDGTNVLISLKPLNLEKLQPFFGVLCTSSLAGRIYKHSCIQSGTKYYAVSGFTSSLSAESGSNACPSGQTLVRYSASIGGNRTHIAQIKSAALQSVAPGVKNVVSALFDGESFFKDYFNNFYQGLLKQF